MVASASGMLKKIFLILEFLMLSSCTSCMEVCVCGILEGEEPLRRLLLLVESSSESSGSEGSFSSLFSGCWPITVVFA